MTDRIKGHVVQQWRLLSILTVYLLLALAYGVVNPLFEAPDEHSHYFTAQYVAETGRLPAVAEPPDRWLGQEAAQPPLYYLLGALLVAPVDTSDARASIWVNPFVRLGDADAAGNINFFIHGPEEAWPWHGYALAAHLLRFLSAFLGAGTLLFIYGSGRLLWPAQPNRALLATALSAFIPQFIFVHSAATNDTLIILLSAAVLWQLLRLWQGPMTRQRLLLLGLTLGLATLSKSAGLLLLPFAAGVLLWRAFWHRDSLWSMLRRFVFFVLAPALAVGGWLLWRNWTLYGDVTAANQFVRLAGGDRGYTLVQALAELPGMWDSLFAVFGWFNVRAPEWIYWLWDGIVLLALVGAGAYHLSASSVREASKETKWKAGTMGGRSAAGLATALWLGGWVLLVSGALLAFMMRTPAAQGRLLFPALLPLTLGLSYGLDSIWRRAWPMMPAVALLTAVYCLVAVIPAAYASPRLLYDEALPPEVVTMNAEMGQGLTLLGYTRETPPVQPDEVAWTTLYWRRQTQPEQAPELVIELFGRKGALVGKYHGYHGRGLYPATLWPTGAIVADQVGVRVAEGMEAPTNVRVQVRLAQGNEQATAGFLEVEPVAWPPPPGPTLAEVGEGIELVVAQLSQEEVAPGQTLTVRLGWRVTQDVAADFTTFVHLGEAGKPPLATGDSPPLQGDYPTSHWEAGEVIVSDDYRLIVPEDVSLGRYAVFVGMYDRQTLERLPVQVEGTDEALSAFRVGSVIIR